MRKIAFTTDAFNEYNDLMKRTLRSFVKSYCYSGVFKINYFVE